MKTLLNIRGLTLALTAIGVLLAWSAFAWLFLALGAERNELNQRAVDRDATTARSAYSLTLRTLARDTLAQRQQLDVIVGGNDAVESIEAVEAAARSAAVSISVDAVTADSISVGRRNDEHIPAVALTLRSSGPFRSLYHYLTLLEYLPRASVVDQVNFERREEAGWSMVARVRVAVGEAQ